eukprot:m.162665 g.162665  ORF g.162665 m.162665 type:complete len:591 (-) comp12224_c0_seq1:200-1972(-)
MTSGSAERVAHPLHRAHMPLAPSPLQGLVLHVGVVVSVMMHVTHLPRVMGQDGPVVYSCGTYDVTYEGYTGGRCSGSCNNANDYRCYVANDTNDGADTGCLTCGDSSDDPNTITGWAFARACDFNTSFISFQGDNCTVCPTCANITDCSDNADAIYEQAPPTHTTDRVCTVTRFRTCDPGKLSTSATADTMSECVDYTDCTAEDRWAPGGVTPTTDAVCSADITNCTAGQPYEETPPTITSDRVCTASEFRTCPTGEFAIPATDVEPSVCTPYTACNAQMKYAPAGVTPTSDAVCSAFLTNCTLNNTWSAVRPTLTSNVRCNRNQPNCTLGSTHETVPPSWTSARVCSRCQECVAGYSYQIVAPTLERDRECGPVTDCNAAGRWASVPATPTSDYQCNELITNCLATGTWSSVLPTQTSDVVCDSVVDTCTPYVTWQSVAPTITSNRVCGRNVTNCLLVDNKWTDSPPTPSTDVSCDKAFTACTSEYPYQANRPTFTSDTLCVAQCPTDTHAVVPATGGGNAAGVCVPGASPSTSTTDVNNAVIGWSAGVGGLVIGVIVATLFHRGMRGSSRAGDSHVLMHDERTPLSPS